MIRPHQAKSAKGKNVIVGEERHEKGVLQNNISRVTPKASKLGEQNKGKGTDSKLTGAKTGLTGAPSKTGNSSRTKDKKRPSFKELLAKYEKKGAV